MGADPLTTLPKGFQMEEETPSPPAGFQIEVAGIPAPPPGFQVETPRPEGPIKRYGKGLLAGVVSIPEGIGRSLQAFIPEPKSAAEVISMPSTFALKYFGKFVADRAKTAREFYSPPDPKFSDMVASGIGSGIGFLIPGLGVSKAVQAANMAPRLAGWLGAGASATLEAMTEGGFAYERAKEKGMPEPKASGAAAKTFWLNLPTIVFTNKLGMFSDKGRIIRKAITSAPLESIQEWTQSIISNFSTHDPLFQGALDSAGVGFVVGFLGGGVSGAVLKPDAKPAFTSKAKFVPIPEFKSTEDAVEFGKSIQGDLKMIEAMKKERDIIRSKNNKIFAIENPTREQIQEGMDQAVKAQLLRESVEAAEGKEIIEQVKGARVETRKELLKSAERKMILLEQVDKMRERVIKGGDPKKIARLDKIEEKNQLTQAEKDALVTDVTGTPPPISAPESSTVPHTPSGSALSAVWNNEIPIESGKESMMTLKPVEFPELVRLAKDLIGGYDIISKKTGKALGRFKTPPREGKIILTPELFQKGNEQHLAITLAHEIGHLIDYLPNQTLKRGNLFGRLNSLHNYMKETFGALTIKNKDIKAELFKVTQHLHPFDPAEVPPAYLKYRNSSKELYAEAISLLLNSPGTMEKMSPKFTKLFFKNLDTKPEVKKHYFDLQEILNGKPEEILARRKGDIRSMFAKGEALRTKMKNEKDLAKVNYWERLRQLIDDVNYPIVSKRQKADSKGEFLPSEKSPEYELEERSLVDNDNFLMISKIDENILKPLKDLGMTESDLGEYLFLKRIEGRPELPFAADIGVGKEFRTLDPVEMEELRKRLFDVTGRKQIANPLGFAPGTASRQLNFLRESLGNEKFLQLEKVAREFHEVIYGIIEEAVEVGSYNRQLFEEKIRPNKEFYAAFGVLNYLQDYVPATVKMQKGTMKEIENPFVTTLLKMVSLNRLNAKQRAVNSLRDWLKSDFSDEIVPAKKNKFKQFIKPSSASGKSLIHVLEDGKLEAYEVDKYIARSVENTKNGDVMLVGHMINRIFGNPLFKNLYITYNPGFAFAFNPMRDFKRTFANLNAIGADVSVGKLLKTYWESLPSAIKRQKGIQDKVVKEMMESKSLDIPFIDFNFNLEGDAFHGTLRELKLLKGEEKLYKKTMKTVFRPLMQVLEGIRFMGSSLESISKISGYNILKESEKFTPKQLSYIMRNYIGTPNYRRGGTITSTTNAVWIFSNIMKEGIKTDLQLAIHPTTKSGFWFSHFKLNLLPKMLMFIAAAGFLGDELKDMFAKISEYDKTNYITIPMGKDDRGKTVYLRVPHDESGRLMSALMWKTLNGIQKKEPESLQQIFSFGAGQLPGLAPGIDIMAKWTSYLSEKNPYDDFRGRYLISDIAWKAGGWPRLKKMVQWTANNAGVIQFATYSDDKDTTFESILRTTPLLNRLLKVSDYGVTESLRKQRERLEKKSAQRTLKKRDLVKEGVEDINKGINIGYVVRNIAKKIHGDRPTRSQLTNIQKSLLHERIRGDDKFVDMMMTARSNEEKELILRQMRQQYDNTQMRRIEKLLMKSRVVSSSVIMKSRREK